MTRIRYIITCENRTKVLCGMPNRYQFRRFDELKGLPIKTYSSMAKAETAFELNMAFQEDYEIVKVTESITFW